MCRPTWSQCEQAQEDTRAFIFYTRYNRKKHGMQNRNSCLQQMHACFLFDSRTMSVCDCPVAAASLKFLKQEGLSAAPSVKLPGYRGNGLEGIFKDTVAQQLLQVIQVFSPVLLTFLPLGFFVQSVQWWNELEFMFHSTALQQEISYFLFIPQLLCGYKITYILCK